MTARAFLIIICSIAILACSEKEAPSPKPLIPAPNTEAGTTEQLESTNDSETVAALQETQSMESDDVAAEVEAVSASASSDTEIDNDNRIEEEAPAIDHSNLGTDLDASPEMVSSTRGNTIYTVESGDSLGGIAKAHNTTVKAIASRNGLSNPDSIAVGQQLQID